jgi:hypothetical protein
MIDGVASQPFSAMSVPPIGSPTGSAEKVIRVSRERYGRHRDIIADKILRWSGMEGGGDELGDDIDTTLENKKNNIPNTVIKENKPKEELDKKNSIKNEVNKVFVKEIPKEKVVEVSTIKTIKLIEEKKIEVKKEEENKKVDYLPGLVDIKNPLVDKVLEENIQPKKRKRNRKRKKKNSDLNTPSINTSNSNNDDKKSYNDMKKEDAKKIDEDQVVKFD